MRSTFNYNGRLWFLLLGRIVDETLFLGLGHGPIFYSPTGMFINILKKWTTHSVINNIWFLKNCSRKMVSNTHFLHYIKFPKNTFPIQFFENYLHCFERKKKHQCSYQICYLWVFNILWTFVLSLNVLNLFMNLCRSMRWLDYGFLIKLLIYIGIDWYPSIWFLSIRF